MIDPQALKLYGYTALYVGVFVQVICFSITMDMDPKRPWINYGTSLIFGLIVGLLWFITIPSLLMRWFKKAIKATW